MKRAAGMPTIDAHTTASALDRLETISEFLIWSEVCCYGT